MKIRNKAFFASTISALLISGLVPSNVLADSWQSKAEAKQAASKPAEQETVSKQTTTATKSSAFREGGLVRRKASAGKWQSRSEAKQAASKTSAQETVSKQSTSATLIDDGLVKHKASSEISAGDRLTIKTKIDGKNGVKLARVYFKSSEASKYSFVVLNKGERGVYSADIPAASNSVTAIEYKIVVQNAFGEIYKTEKYAVLVSPTDVVATASTEAGFISVYSEYPENEADSSGFVDKVRYTYSATKIATQVGQALSVSSSGGGYVGGSSASSAGASTTASTTATTSASSTSLTTASAVGAGAVGTSVITDPSGKGGDCFTGIIEITEESFDDSDVIETIGIGFSSGIYNSLSVRVSGDGCEDLSHLQEFLEEENFEDELNDGECFTKQQIDLIIEEENVINTNIVSSHSCPSISF